MTLAQLMEERVLGQSEVAASVGVHPSMISKILSGTRRAKPRTVRRMARYFGVQAIEMQSILEETYRRSAESDPEAA